jgi:hypothetical protein
MLLAIIALAAFAVGRTNSLALGNDRAALVGDPDMLVPAAVKADPNWKPQPAGAPVALPWANIRVNTDNTTEAQNEPFVAVNPVNSQHLVVGANNWLYGNGNFEVSAYVSFDGGRTWTSSQPYINRNASRLSAADPTVAFGPDGSVYFAFIAFGPAEGAVAVSRSLDGGLTWATQSWATSFTGGAADKPVLAGSGSNLYVFWQASNGLLSRVSGNNGLSWSATVTVGAGGRNAAPVVGADGAVNVFYTVGNSLRLGRSTDKGASYSNSTVSSLTALQPRAAQFRAEIIPMAAAGADGALYVAWADGRNAGRGNDILASRSLDGGATWSAPTVVNNDGGAADQLMPALTLGADGVLTAAWLDTRNDPSRVNYDIYIARAVTNASGLGFSFGANTRVTNISSNPNNDPRLQGTMIGDYFAIAAGNGLVYPVWTDTRNNNQDIYLAPVPIGSATND